MKYQIALINQVWNDSLTDDQKLSLGVLDFFIDTKTDNKILVSQQEKTVYITLSSTKTWWNWVQDFFEFPLFKNRRKHSSTIKFHQGFWDAYATNREALLSYLKKINPERLTIEGHSQGGATAGICAIDLLEQGYNVEELLMLACPKFTNKAGIDFLTSKIKTISSFLNGNDWIFWVAPFLKRLNYVRIGIKKKWVLFSFKDHQLADNPPGNQGYIHSLQNYLGTSY